MPNGTRCSFAFYGSTVTDSGDHSPLIFFQYSAAACSFLFGPGV